MTETRIVKGGLALWSRECQFYEWGPDLLNSRRGPDDKGDTMRTIGLRSNILFAIAAAFGIIAALGRPWYGPPSPATDADMEDLFGGIGRSLTEPNGAAGWTALGTADQLLAGFAIATVALLLLTLVPAVQRHMQPLARWCALAAVGVVLVKLIDGPDAAATSQPRNGIFLALAASLVLLASTWTVAAAPSRKRVPPKTYTPPPAPVYGDDASYGPPQF
jgi:hypothetical protein